MGYTKINCSLDTHLHTRQTSQCASKYGNFGFKYRPRNALF